MHLVETRERSGTGPWVLMCSCGRVFVHRDAVGAERLAEYHMGLENAREALGKDTA